MTRTRPRLVVLNGELDWGDYFPGAEVLRHRLQDTTFALQDGVLQAFDPDASTPCSGASARCVPTSRTSTRCT